MLPGGIINYYYTCFDQFTVPEGLSACEFLYVDVRVAEQSYRFDPVIVMPGHTAYLRAQLDDVIHEKSFQGPVIGRVRNRWQHLSDDMIFTEFNM